MAVAGRQQGKAPLWSADLVLAAVINFCLAVVFYMLVTTMALYAIAQFAVSDTAGGLASSSYVVGATVARLFAGNLVDLIGKRRILIASLGVFVLASASYYLADTFGALLAVRTVHGLAFGLASTAAMSLAQSVIPPSRQAEGTGYFTLSMTLGTAFGPYLALRLVADRGYDALFSAGVIAAVVSLLAALFLSTERVQLDPEHRARLRRFHPRDLLHPAVLPVAGFMMVMSVSYSGVLAYLQTYSAERDLLTGAQWFFLVYASTLLCARLVAGRVQDRHGDNVIVIPAIVFFSAGLVTLAVAQSDAVLLVSAALQGLGFGTLMSALQSVVVSKVPRHRIGVAISTYYFMVDLGVGFGPVLLGAVLAASGFGALFGSLAGVVLVSTLLYLAVHGRQHGRRPVPLARAQQQVG